MGYEIKGGLLLGGGGGAFEELVAERAVSAEALSRRSSEHAGLATGGARLFRFHLGGRLGQLNQGQRLDRLHHGHRFARRRLGRRYRWCL